MNGAAGLRVFPSFNCFGACAGTVLGRWYGWGLHLALHSRWQFFYRTLSRYDDDNRFVGEHPRPCDATSLAGLRDVLGVAAAAQCDGEAPHCDGEAPDLGGIAADLEALGASIVLADKFYLEQAAGAPQPKHVLTTVIIVAVDRGRGRADYLDPFGDDGVPESGWLGTDVLARARVAAPHGRGARGWRLALGLPQGAGTLDRERAARSAAPYMARSTAAFVRGARGRGMSLGAPAIRRLAGDVAAWSGGGEPWTRRVLDASRHLAFVQRQRAAFAAALGELGQGLPALAEAAEEWRREAQALSDRWQRLRLLMYLGSARRQAGALVQVAQELGGLAGREEAFAAEVAGRLREVGP